ncbi:MAG TPA: hypothetical protein VF414_13635, partial [Thermoanaerobaculia bacterium]
MIRKLLLLIAAVLTLALPARACPTVIQPIPPPSDYEAVDAATRIVLASPVGLDGDEVRFAVEEVLKGDSGTLRLQGSFSQAGEGARDPWCLLNTGGCFLEGSLYLLFLDREERATVADRFDPGREPGEGW